MNMKKTTTKTSAKATAKTTEKELTGMEKLVKEYRLPMTSTPEALEMGRFKVLTFGNKVLISGYRYTFRGNCYYGAVYEFTDGTTIEDEIRLTAVSEERFADDGHAIQWAMAH